MLLLDHIPGFRYRPLSVVRLGNVPSGQLMVRDGRGRVYYNQSASGEASFLVGGALGWHTATLTSQSGELLASLQFQVEAHTFIRESSGAFSELFEMCHFTMADEPTEHYIRYQGRTYFFLVSWLRDHVHTLKGMKYFEPHLRDGIELFRDSQRDDGMLWDFVRRREPPSAGPSDWSARFSYLDFQRMFEDGTAEFVRMPVEADVEYLYVEGLYFTWKATGDTAWMASCLDSAIRALDYSRNSPLRWSEVFNLIKRGHTIDTWDFQSECDALPDFNPWDWPDPMVIHPKKTHFGVMFGDNTGYAAACEYLAEMLDAVDCNHEAGLFRQRAVEIRIRLDQVAWNGQFYYHHIPEHPEENRDLGVDEYQQISLSNAYSLNRGIEHSKCAAILQTYQQIRYHLPAGSPGEWYLIYPPFPTGYAGHNDLWQYMNGGVSTIVAGELAHGAFENGFESYGVDILLRAHELGKQHGKQFWECYTGAFPSPPARALVPISLLPYANVKSTLEDCPTCTGWQPQNRPPLDFLPRGEQVIHEIPFDLPKDGKNTLALSSRSGYLPEVEIPLAADTRAVYLLHAFALSSDLVAGELIFNYSDGSTDSTYLTSGKNILPLSHHVSPNLPLNGDARLACQVRHPRFLHTVITLAGFESDPVKKVQSITLRAVRNGSIWLVAGLTTSDAPVWLPAPPISYGIPRGWGAAALTYALIEGLAGVVDQSVAFGRALVAPRWSAAEVEQAEVVVHYPASNGYIAYRYHYDLGCSTLNLTVTGSGERVDLHILLPASAQSVAAVLLDGLPVPHRMTTLENSKYVEIDLPLDGIRQLAILFHDGDCS